MDIEDEWMAEGAADLATVAQKLEAMASGKRKEWFLVPAVATPAMIRAYRSKHVGGGFSDEAYKAMLQAAPKL